MILSGYVPTPVPGPTEVPTRVPGPVVVATRVPGPAVVETEIPGPVIVPTPVPGPTIVATPMPFWLRQITGILRAEGEIQVQVLGVTLDSSEAMTVRGQGLLSAVLSSMDLAPADQFLRGQAAIWAVVAGDREVEYPVHLEGRGEILASGVAMVMSAGVRALAGRGAVTAGGISTALQALVNLRGQGRVTASPTAMALTDPVARLLAGRGAITITGATRTLNIPTYQMTKSGTQAGQGTGYNTLTGMAADAGYPGTIVDNSAALRIPDGLPSYAANIHVEVPHTGGSSPRYGQSQIYMNGSLVATGAQQSASPGTSTVDWSGNVQAGDYFVIQWRGEGNFFQRPTAQAGAFLRVTPA